MNKKIFIIAGVILVVGLLIACMFIPDREKDMIDEKLGITYSANSNEASLKYDTKNPVVAMYIENYGSVVMELYPDIAPNTVNNFISLVLSGFYDNNSFHRLVPGFVLQGGDPTGTGSGGPGYHIKGEFTENGFENNLSHEKWVISMARSQSMDSAGSQFFICIDNATALDGKYASFGKVIDGFDTIDSIVQKEVIADSNSGKLQTNLILRKAVVDLKGKKYSEVEKVSE